MKITMESIGQVTVLVLEGKILIGDGDDTLREAVLKLLDAGRRYIVLDLAEVPYIDHAGLGEVVRCRTLTYRKGGKLVLCNLTRKIQGLLSLTRLLAVFETYESRASAIEVLRNG